MEIGKQLTQLIRSPNVTHYVRFFLDECLPPIIRDSRWFFSIIIKLYNPKIDLDFKRKAIFMNDHDFTKFYEIFDSGRETDLTGRHLKFLLNGLIGETVLEVSSGNGDFAIFASKHGYNCLATDISEIKIKKYKKS